MFSQIGVIVLAALPVGTGLREGDYLNVGLGLLVGAFAASIIYQLKTGR